MAIQFDNKLKPQVKPEWNNIKGLKAYFSGGPFSGKTFLVEDLFKLPQFKDLIEGLSEESGMYRKELARQPLIKGYHSPAWGGDKLLHYETPEVANSYD